MPPEPVSQAFRDHLYLTTAQDLPQSDGVERLDAAIIIFKDQKAHAPFSVELTMTNEVDWYCTEFRASIGAALELKAWHAERVKSCKPRLSISKPSPSTPTSALANSHSATLDPRCGVPMVVTLAILLLISGK